MPLFQKGTFIDGQLYKTVAFNSSRGMDFWSMKFSNSCMSFFCEQPPLYFYLLGLFYSLFGTNDFADRLFTLTLFFLLVFIVNTISRLLFKEKSFFYSCLVIFFLISIEVLCWSFANQVIEPLVCVFAAAGIYFFLKFLVEKKGIYIFLFIATLVLLFLSKGFQSCFLIGLPFIYFLISGFKKQMLRFLVVSGIVFAFILISGFIFYKPAFEWLQCYYNSRLVLTMNNVGGTTEYHAEIIFRFFTELLPCFILIGFLFIYLKVKRNYPSRFILRNFISNKLASAFLFTSLLGSFPFAISLVQRGFYLLPSFVFFIIAITYGLKRYWLVFGGFLTRISVFRVVRIVVMLLTLGSIVFFSLRVNSFKRDKELISDVKMILPYFKANDTITIDEGLWNYVSLHSLLYMEKGLNLTTSNTRCKYMLVSKQENDSAIVAGSFLPTQTIDLILNKNRRE